jgi:hypothetical protein
VNEQYLHCESIFLAASSAFFVNDSTLQELSKNMGIACATQSNGKLLGYRSSRPTI